MDGEPTSYLDDVLSLTAELLHLTLGFDTLALVTCAAGDPRKLAFGGDDIEQKAAALTDATTDACGRLAGCSAACRAAPPLARRLSGANGRAHDASLVFEDAPLVVHGEVRGLIRAGRRAALSDEQRRAYFAAAQQLSMTLERDWAQLSRPAASGETWIQGLRDGVIVLDAEMRVLALNDAAVAHLQPLGVTPVKDAALRAPALAAAALEALASGEPQPSVEMTGEGDARRYISLTATPTPGADRVVLVLRDVTEERLMQERLLQSEKMASVGQLVSGVAHELNNPLTGVMGFAQLLLMRDHDERTRREVETIYSEAERASKIVQNLLSFARRRRAQKEMVNINSLVQRVLELRNYELAVRDIEVSTNLDPRLPETMVDPGQIQQVFLNIIINAEQAILSTKRGGRLAIRSYVHDGLIKVAFRDDGPGISAENLRRIFDPFFTTKPAGEGTGLGLTISYGIIDEHGGRIVAESRPDQGAVFTVELPITDRAATPASPEPVPQPTAQETAVRTVLVVDDEESIRTLLRGILGIDGHKVDVAANGREALERIGRQHYDVIITDIKMPVMDGQALYRRLKEIDRDLARRMIFITGDTVGADTRTFLHRINNPCLPKPFRVREVREAVDRALNS